MQQVDNPEKEIISVLCSDYKKEKWHRASSTRKKNIPTGSNPINQPSGSPMAPLTQSYGRRREGRERVFIHSTLIKAIFYSFICCKEKIELKLSSQQVGQNTFYKSGFCVTDAKIKINTWHGCLSTKGDKRYIRVIF